MWQMMIKNGARLVQSHPFHRVSFKTVDSQHHRYVMRSKRNPLFLSTCSCINLRIFVNRQRRSNRLTINQFTQLRFKSLNPFDDDEEEDEAIKSNVTKDDQEHAAVHDMIDDVTDDSDNDSDGDGDNTTNEEDEIADLESPTRNIKKFEVPDGPTPGPIIFQKTNQETFFQFDYRNNPTPENIKPNLASLLQKIQITLKGTELEPYHNRRGCETLRNNINNLPDGAKFRAGGDKKSVKKVGEGYDKAVNCTTHRALRKSMFYLLWERHAIMTSGTTHDWKKLTSKAIGQSLLGPDTRIVVDQRLGKEIIQELWIRGVSSKYNRIIKRHEDRSGENNYLQYLQPNLTKREIAQMDWNTDLNLKSDEKRRT